MAEHFPNSRFVGYDLSAEATEKAKKTAAEKGLTNIKFEKKDMSEFTAHEEFDLITAFDAIHDQADPAGVLAKISRALHPDGIFLMQDIAASSFLENNVDHPIGPLLYALSCTHCLTVSLAQNGAGLGTMWGEETAHRMLSEAGFTNTETRKLPHDFQNNFYINRKSS
jgi:2-polyprenyl-3-methyl-5-hydroxy-6-metoxy-1,4-benzoquinol methylase